MSNEDDLRERVEELEDALAETLTNLAWEASKHPAESAQFYTSAHEDGKILEAYKGEYDHE